LFCWCSVYNFIWWCFYFKYKPRLLLKHLTLSFACRKLYFSWSKWFFRQLIGFTLLWFISWNVSTIFHVCMCVLNRFMNWWIISAWIGSVMVDSYHYFILVMVFPCWIKLYLFELYQPSSRGILIDSNFVSFVSIFMAQLVCLLLSESNHTLSESIHYVVFGQIFALTTLPYIYSYPHNTQTTESFASILSRVSKPHFPLILQI